MINRQEVDQALKGIKELTDDQKTMVCLAASFILIHFSEKYKEEFDEHGVFLKNLLTKEEMEILLSVST